MNDTKIHQHELLEALNTENLLPLEVWLRDVLASDMLRTRKAVCNALYVASEWGAGNPIWFARGRLFKHTGYQSDKDSDRKQLFMILADLEAKGWIKRHFRKIKGNDCVIGVTLNLERGKQANAV